MYILFMSNSLIFPLPIKETGCIYFAIGGGIP